MQLFTPFILLAATYGIASVLCFAAYAVDKSAARAGRRRVRERTLLMLGLACGWPGAVLAQQCLRHKSAKPAFLWRSWGTVLLNLAVLACFVLPNNFLKFGV
jgi:uncharacterized membrane protein YsdA (DUF1294 family)